MRASAGRLTKALLALVLASLMSGCANTSATDGCSWVSLILWSRHDVLTEGTKQQLLAHNEAVEKFCRAGG